MLRRLACSCALLGSWLLACSDTGSDIDPGESAGLAGAAGQGGRSGGGQAGGGQAGGGQAGGGQAGGNGPAGAGGQEPAGASGQAGSGQAGESGESGGSGQSGGSGGVAGAAGDGAGGGQEAGAGPGGAAGAAQGGAGEAQGGAGTASGAGGTASAGGAGAGGGAGSSGGSGQGGAAGAADAVAACIAAAQAKGEVPKVTPVGTPNAFTLGGQTAWYHDEGFSAGYFHTYDALDVAKGKTPAHKVNVFLPRGYEADKSKRYPVVYMNDGTTAFFPGGPANKSWRTSDALAILYECGAIDEVIVAAVWPVDRNQEYTHAAWQDGTTCCGVGAYGDYLAGPLKGFLDASYRTKPERAFTTIVGSSHGGLAAFHVAATHGATFGHAVAMSSSFWVGLDVKPATIGGPLASSALLAATAPTLDDASLRPRLWIDWGLVRTGGDHNSVTEAFATSRGREMRDLLVASHGYEVGSTLSWMEDPAGQHDEDSWARRLPMALRAALAP